MREVPATSRELAASGFRVGTSEREFAEVYPSLWTRRFPRESRDGDQQAAYAVSAWLQRADLNGSLPQFLNDHFKSGQRLSVQNRPTEVAVQD
jgi:hypothetical protein